MMSVKLCGGSLLHRTTPPKWVPKRRLSGSRTKRGITSGIFGRGSQDAFRERKWRVCCCPLYPQGKGAYPAELVELDLLLLLLLHRDMAVVYYLWPPANGF